MRHVLVDYARATDKRGGPHKPLSLEDAGVISGDRMAEVIALDDALTALSKLHRARLWNSASSGAAVWKKRPRHSRSHRRRLCETGAQPGHGFIVNWSGTMQTNTGMTPERYQRLSELFAAACERSGDARAAFLDEACAGDDALRRAVEVLLAADQKLHGWLEKPLVELASTVPGDKIGPYRIEAKLGEGGMGTVFRALDTRLNRPMAIKFLHDVLADAAARRRFQREAKLLASLDYVPYCTPVNEVC
jgi:hypothetical protein